MNDDDLKFVGLLISGIAVVIGFILYVFWLMSSLGKNIREYERGQAAEQAAEHEQQMKAARAETERLARERDEAEAARQQALQAIVRVERDRTPSTGLSAAPSAQEVATFTKGALSMQCRVGRGIFVSVLTSPDGVVIDWRVDVQGALVPEVVGSCDSREIFKEFAFRGRHPDRFEPGRHRLSFVVHHGEARAKSNDLFFDISVPPELEPKQEPKHWKEELQEQAAEFFDRTKAVNNVKRKIEAELREQGQDDDEIDVVLGRFEATFGHST